MNINKKKTSYTYKTIEYFNKKKPNDTLYWIMGEDRYFDFSTWKNFEIIKNLAKIVIYRRSNEINEEISNDESVIYLKDSFFDISSTKILNEVRWDLIPEEAKTYIAKNKLYLKTLVFNVLKEKRYEHSVAVASHAKRLADRYKYKNVEKAWITGLVHDFFKLKSDKFLLDYKSKYGKNYPDVPIPALHGLVVALWLKEEYKWYDKEVFDALTSHTLGKSNASKLDKIIFVADKISTDRKGHKVGKLRKLAYKNLDFTYIKLIKNLIKKLKNKNIDPHINTIEAYRYYIDPKFLSTDLDFTLKKNKKTIINQ